MKLYHCDSITVKKDYLSAVEAENRQLKEEASKLKEDLERLHSIFDVTTNSNRKDNHEIDVELAAVREQFRLAKEENVYLKEKNDTLFKLGKMALDKEKSKEPLLEIVEQEDTDGLDALVQSVMLNKNSKKTNLHQETIASNVKKVNKESNTEQSPKQSQPANENVGTQRIQYCHFFSNFGHCQFEEKTGRKCKFAHEKAPLCKFGSECNRKKCMYSHPQARKNNSQTTQNFHMRNSEFPFLRQPHQNMKQYWQPQPQPHMWMLQQMWEMMANQTYH